MRPDEHKRKRSAQYKKAHGVKGSHPQDKKNTEKPKQKLEQCKEEKVNRKPAQASKYTSNSSSSEDESSEHQQRKTYSRREVVSNWKRYDLMDDNDDDIPLQRGDDFNKLLGKAGAASSQFRFKDEEDWEVDLTKTQSDVLSVDLNSLAGSLQCIPLYKRLNLDKDLFSEEQLNCMEQEALLHQSVYSPEIKRDTQKESNVCKRNQQSNSENIHVHVDTLSNDGIIEEVKCARPSNVVTTVTDKICNTPQLTTKGVCDLGNHGDDLDLLLSLDNPSSVSDKVQGDIKTDIAMADDNKTTESQNKTLNSVKDDRNKEDLSNNQELEDWLDSILD